MDIVIINILDFQNLLRIIAFQLKMYSCIMLKQILR